MQYALDGRSGSLDPNVLKNEPADPDDPLNHAFNRRVEIKVYSPEGL